MKGQTMTTFKKLQRWEMPDSYFGAQWPEYFVFLGQNRESSALERSNFRCGLEALGGEGETIIVVRERHWACGWVEWIGIHESNEAALEYADSTLCSLDSYPVLNEDDFCQLENEEAEHHWQSMPLRYRVELCREAGVSIFAARHESIPMEDGGYIYERCLS